MSGRTSFDYAIVRVVPRVERGEFVNVGVILHCRTQKYLGVKLDFELKRVQALAPTANCQMIRNQLQVIQLVVQGGPQAKLFRTWSTSERFNWLVAPISTIIQTSPVHCGLGNNPVTELEALYTLFVA